MSRPLIRHIPSTGEVIEFLKDENKHLIKFLKSQKSGGCYCYVGEYDGYHGTSHTDNCKNIMKFLKDKNE